MTTATLLWGVLFSGIGIGFTIYGRRQKANVPLACGIGLMIYPYFIPNTTFLVVIGLLLTAIPYFIRR
jgi:hypothetical protein